MKTLEELLNENGIFSGDDRGFILMTSLFSSTRMEVSRRYLECETYKHLLKRKVFSVTQDYNSRGLLTSLIILGKED